MCSVRVLSLLPPLPPPPPPPSLAQMDSVVSAIRDQNLKFTLSFGIGLHHAGLHEHDRRTVEQLFVNQKIQVHVQLSQVRVYSSPHIFRNYQGMRDSFPTH